MVICAPTYCGTIDIAYLGGDIQYQQLGFATAATYYNWIYGTLIFKAQDVVDNYAGHNFKANDGTITLDGGGKEALHINRIGLVDGSPPTLLPLPLRDITSVVIDSAASVHASRGDRGEHPERIEALLRYGANVNARGPHGRTALHCAAKAGFSSVIQVLLDGGADVNARMDDGTTPLHAALRARRVHAAKLLHQHGAEA